MHPHAYVLFFQYIYYIWNVLGIFWLSLSLLLSSVCVSLCLWHLNASLLCPKTLFVLGHPLRLILLLLISNSVIRMHERTSWRTFLDEVFIWNAKSFWWTSSTLTYPLSFTVGVGSHYVTSQSLFLPCWSKSFTSTCMELILQYLFFLLTFEVRALLSCRSLLRICSMFRG